MASTIPHMPEAELLPEETYPEGAAEAWEDEETRRRCAVVLLDSFATPTLVELAAVDEPVLRMYAFAAAAKILACFEEERHA